MNYNYTLFMQGLGISSVKHTRGLAPRVTTVPYHNGANPSCDYFTYDKNGNMSQDLNKRISLIQYN